jgi:hypothetical protein
VRGIGTDRNANKASCSRGPSKQDLRAIIRRRRFLMKKQHILSALVLMALTAEARGPLVWAAGMEAELVREREREREWKRS